jgi:uncharacterized membrane protein
MQSLDRDSQLYEDDVTDTMFAKSHDIIVLMLIIVLYWYWSLYLECTFAEPLTENIVLISLNEFEIYLEITPDGSLLLEFAPWTQIK